MIDFLHAILFFICSNCKIKQIRRERERKENNLSFIMKYSKQRSICLTEPCSAKSALANNGTRLS